MKKSPVYNIGISGVLTAADKVEAGYAVANGVKD